MLQGRYDAIKLDRWSTAASDALGEALGMDRGQS